MSSINSFWRIAASISKVDRTSISFFCLNQSHSLTRKRHRWDYMNQTRLFFFFLAQNEKTRLKVKVCELCFLCLGSVSVLRIVGDSDSDRILFEELESDSSWLVFELSAVFQIFFQERTKIPQNLFNPYGSRNR